MPSYKLYKLIHLTSLVVAVMSISGVTFHAWLGGTREQAGRLRKRLLGLHGLAMVGMLVGGMGLGAISGAISHQNGWEHWIFGKLVLWLVLGALPALPYRYPRAAPWLWLAVPVLVALAGWLAGGLLPLTR